MARSSISAGIASKRMPALPNSICRARLCDARINGSFPRQRVMVQPSLRKPVTLAICIEFQHSGSGFLDRAPRHIQLGPVEFSAKPFCERDLVGYGLAIDVIVVAGRRAHA